MDGNEWNLFSKYDMICLTTIVFAYLCLKREKLEEKKMKSLESTNSYEEIRGREVRKKIGREKMK